MRRTGFELPGFDSQSDYYSRHRERNIATLYWPVSDLYYIRNSRRKLEQLKYNSCDSECKLRISDCIKFRNNQYYLYSKQRMWQSCISIEEPDSKPISNSWNSIRNISALYRSVSNVYYIRNSRWKLEQLKYNSCNSKCKFRSSNSSQCRNNYYYLYSA